MRFRQYFEQTAVLASPEGFSTFQSHIDPDWIEQALSATGTATLRRRRLPADQVVWLVVALGLYRDRPITTVVSDLNLVLPGTRGPRTAPSAITQARARIGDEPIKWLFEKCAKQWAHASANEHRWRGLALYGVDGTTERLPDSDDNRNFFGGPDCGDGNKSGYPVVRMAVLMALRSHLLVHAAFGPYETSELKYAEDLWDHVPSDSLCIVDKGFFSADILISLSKREHRNWLIRAKSHTKWKPIKNLGYGDDLVEMEVSKQARRKNPSLPKTWIARAITYTRKGFLPQTLLTSLFDPVLYPAKEIVKLYHERWELELAYGEIKTDLLLGMETLRSQKPSGVRQEIWGILLAYNLIRLEIEKIAKEANVLPTRISFIMAMRFIQDEWRWCASSSPGSIPKNLRRLRESVKDFILPERRSNRSYPRALKTISSKYPSQAVAKRLDGVLK